MYGATNGYPVGDRSTFYDIWPPKPTRRGSSTTRDKRRRSAVSTPYCATMRASVCGWLTTAIGTAARSGRRDGDRRVHEATVAERADRNRYRKYSFYIC